MFVGWASTKLAQRMGCSPLQSAFADIMAQEECTLTFSLRRRATVMNPTRRDRYNNITLGLLTVLFVLVSDVLAQHPLLEKVPKLHETARRANRGEFGHTIGTVMIITSRGKSKLKPDGTRSVCSGSPSKYLISCCSWKHAPSSIGPKL